MFLLIHKKHYVFYDEIHHFPAYFLFQLRFRIYNVYNIMFVCRLIHDVFNIMFQYIMFLFKPYVKRDVFVDT